MIKIDSINIYDKTHLLERERFIVKVAQFFLSSAQKRNVSLNHVAERLGKQRSQIYKQLSGDSNLTLRTLFDISYALGLRPRIEFDDILQEEQEYSSSTHRYYTPKRDFNVQTRISKLENSYEKAAA